MDRPIVSICMSTYNHELFIYDAVEGVLNQQTGFPIELVIGEDLSEDNTRSNCETLASKYPGVIRLLDSDRKYGQCENLYRIIQSCRGKYIALCEGDDYWTDMYKLKKQVDFLESHPDFVMCFHKVNTVDDHNTIMESVEENEEVKVYDGADLFHVFVSTLSLMFRNCLHEFPREFFCIKSTDAFIVGMLSGFGKGADLGFIGGHYRKHSRGCYNSLSIYHRYRQSLKTRKFMRKSPYFNKFQKAEINRELLRRAVMYMKVFLKRYDLVSFFKILYVYLIAW